jgi:pyrimidine deaminase RibD-like protein
MEEIGERLQHAKFARLAIEEARKSISENDGRSHPMVGVVVVKDGQVLATAHRGEVDWNHAEFIALEIKLADVPISGSTVYCTLEPCTTRSHTKVPCAFRLIERKVGRVFIGMLDPDRRISGRGQRRLRKANITTDFFTPDLMAEVEDLNREFIRTCESLEKTPGPEELRRLVENEVWKTIRILDSRAAGIKLNSSQPDYSFEVIGINRNRYLVTVPNYVPLPGIKASVITSKAANRYHFKTGQRDWPSRTENVLPCRLLWWQVSFGTPAPWTALEHIVGRAK